MAQPLNPRLTSDADTPVCGCEWCLVLDCSLAMSNISLFQRVLIVEDDALLRWAIHQTIAGVGHVVTTVTDVPAAERALREMSAPVDVLLVGHPLPNSDVFAMMAHLQRTSPATAVVFMPVFNTGDDILIARKLGAVGVLKKPFDMRVLHRAIFDAAGI